MNRLQFQILLILGLSCAFARAQDSFAEARSLAFQGDHGSAKDILENVITKNPVNIEARSLLARTYSWEGEYKKARGEFNKVTSTNRQDRTSWISAVKNELYAGNNATALGLANKGLTFIKGDQELERLRQMAMQNVINTVYKPYPKKTESTKKFKKTTSKKSSSKKPEKKSKEKKVAKNTFGVSNSFRIFTEVYEPMTSSRIDFKHKTKYGSIISKINYGNRFQTHGLQYGVDMYPKVAKKMYAFLSYGYSNSSIFPNHQFAGDLYVNLPKGIEVSGGMRHLSFDARKINIFSNSLGLYKGNYYFSLRTFFTPRENNLNRISGNLLVRRYLKDSENYFGVSGGMGVSPGLRQIVLDGTLLSETIFYLESQRLNFEYQFTGKNTPNIYKTRVGVSRQELFSDPGNFLFTISGGLTYKVKF